jgi:hypothetical protein
MGVKAGASKFRESPLVVFGISLTAVTKSNSYWIFPRSTPVFALGFPSQEAKSCRRFFWLILQIPDQSGIL